jgi:hypothetical protein
MAVFFFSNADESNTVTDGLVLAVNFQGSFMELLQGMNGYWDHSTPWKTGEVFLEYSPTRTASYFAAGWNRP